MEFTRIQPHYFDQANGIAMFQGDSVRVLDELLPDFEGKIGCTLTDPPYGIKYVSNYQYVPNALLGQAIKNDEDLSLLSATAPIIDKLMKQDSALYFFAHPNMVGENRAIFDAYWKFKNLLVWDKGEGGTFGDLEAGYSLNYENIFYYNKGRRKLNGSRPRTILRHNIEHCTDRSPSEVSYSEFLACIQYLAFNLPETEREEVLEGLPNDVRNMALRDLPKSRIRFDWSARNDPVHPTAKPIHVLSLLIKYSTDPDDIVLDPFMGSGTCAAACKLTGRKFIGIEIRPEFFRIAQNRITNVGVKNV